MNQERLWTRDFVTIALTNFLIYVVFYLLMVVMASYAVDRFHATTGMAGLVSGIFIIGILFGRLGTGRLTANMAGKTILVWGTLSFIITSALYLAAVNLPLLVFIRFIHGFAYGIASTATGTIVAQIIPDKRKGEGIGYYSMSQIIATALGPYLGIILSRRVDFTIIFIITSVIAAISFTVSLTITNPGRKAPEKMLSHNGKHLRLSDFIEFSAIPISTIVLIVGFGYSVILAFLSLYSKQLHVEGAASYFFLVYAIVVVISRPFSGRLLDARGASVVVYPCLLIFGVGMFLLGSAVSGVTLLVSGAIIGLGYGNFLSCGQAISIKGAPSNRLGLATATYYIFLDVGFGVGPYLFGSLIPLVGYAGLYRMLAAVILATILLYYVLYRRETV